MKRASVAASSRVTDLVYAGIALVAAVLAVVGAQFHPAVIVAMLIALVPWALLVFGVELPQPAFAAISIIPVIPVIALSEIGAALFLSLAAASRLASRSDDRWLVGTVTVVILVLPFVPFLFGVEWDVGAIYFAFGGAFSVLVGVLLRRATRLADELRAAEGELAVAAAREERHRIARDVHDLVAHSLTVVVLHVGGARRLLRKDPDAAEAALIEAERVSRESLDAIRGAVGMLRDDDESEAASLDLERLVTTYRSAGLPVVLRVNGTAEPLSLPLRLTLYRVVQEALANAARHSAPGTSATVEIGIDDHAVVARVSNEFTPTGATGPRFRRLRARRTAGADRLARRRAQQRARGRRVGRRVPASRRGCRVTAPAPLRLLLVDDQAMVRAGLALILGAEPDISVVAECADGTGVLPAVRAHQPDLVLMDVRMPRMDGPEATRQLRAASDSPPVLALTTFDDDSVLWGALTAGAAGFVLKDSPAEDLIAAVRAVAAGGAWLDPRVLPRVLARAKDRAPASPAASRALEQLTPRELEVLRRICLGANNREIAAQLRVGERTVKSHVSAIFMKLGARDRAAAIIAAYDAGLRT